MKLRGELAADGTLWYANPFPRVMSQFAQALLVMAFLSLLGPAWVIVRSAFAGVLEVSILEIFLILLPIILFVEAWRYRTRRAGGAPDPATPVRIGYAPNEILLESIAGVQVRLPWSEIQAIGASMHPGLKITMTVWIRGATYDFTNANLDLVLKAIWALKLYRSGSLDVGRLADEWFPEYNRTTPPPAGAVEVASEPPLFLLRDSVIVWKREKGSELPREVVSAVRLRLMGADRFVVTARDRQVAVIVHPEDAEPFLAWLGSPPLPPPPA